MGISMSEVLKATGLTRNGRVMDATRLIRRALGLETPSPKRDQPQKIPTIVAIATSPYPAVLEAAPIDVPIKPVLPARPSSFTNHDFTFANEQYTYRLYLPGASKLLATTSSPLPVVVMLHGCKQDAADFAAGTAMNELAEQQKCIVLYPEQRAKANGMRCWNWFETAHQKRNSGEPGMIVALTRTILASPVYNADSARVYICGLSAGGAMASVVADLHPDLFAAVGVHSGLPSGAASDVMSAFSAMRSGATRSAIGNGKDSAVPTIVFHGSADKTVHPDNGDDVVNVALMSLGASGVVLEKILVTDESSNGEQSSRTIRRTAQRTIYRAENGKSYVEHWEIASGPHAWSGGSSTGSYTDPQGPGASSAMLEFFLQHHK